MLSSISPLGERARSARWWRTTSAYLIASAVGGALAGTALGGLGSLVGPSRGLTAVALGVAVAGVLGDVTGRIPAWRRQVDENWLHAYRDWVYGAGFGFQLGVGAVTIVTSAATYLTWALELATAHPLTGLAIGATFGVMRGLPLLAMAGADTPAEVRRRNAAIVGGLPIARRGAIAGQAIAAAALVAVLVAA